MTAAAESSNEYPPGWVARLKGVSHRYRNRYALRDTDLELPAGRMVGLIGPDGVGKSSLLALVAGVRVVQAGEVLVLGGDISREEHREAVCPRIAYMPQGLGKNLYPTLSVRENVDFFGRLFGLGREERAERIAVLLEGTGLAPFPDRPAGKLSGGMKQKLGLCCALIHEPDFLILDEPTTGVDPLSRRQFWELIGTIRRQRPWMSVVVATAYMDEASRFDWLIAMDDGGVLDAGTPGDLLRRTGTGTLEAAFIALLPEGKRLAHQEVKIPPRSPEARAQVAIESRDLTMRFGDFVAVDKVSFRIERGEIFGFLGSNGCGKTTTMKMLTGLLPASEGQAWVFGEPVNAQDLANRRRIGYMSQGFSLYSELTVRQNLVLHARLFDVPAREIASRARGMAERFGLTAVMDELPESLPLGQRQRLSLAVALIHQPELLILDEPTSGVDPIARDAFWQFLVELSREDHVTIFISTHFVDEAQRCDRISLMHAGKVLVCDSPDALMEKRGAASLEDAFIGYLEDASPQPAAAPDFGTRVQQGGSGKHGAVAQEDGRFSLARLLSFSMREALELSRDPVRLTLALLGSVILLLVNGFGISFDVEKLTFAVLDRDQSTISRDYHLNLAGSRYFLERPPLTSYQEMDRRMISGDTSLVVEIPPDFGKKLERGTPVELGVWVDGSMPQRGETIEGYVAGMHAQWLARRVRETRGEDAPPEPARVETRFLYNPGIKSIVAMVPAVMPLLLILIPAMLTALAVVREKEMGSIVNLYVTPVSRLEFLVGKQLPYILVGFLNYLVLAGQAAILFGIPFKGSFPAQAVGALLYVASSTAFGLLISTFMRSQIAAIFGTAFLTVLPAVQFSGMLDPVSSLEGPGALIGAIHPTAYFLIISRGTFSKGLGFSDLAYAYVPLILAIPVLIGLSVSLLRKQEA